MMRVEITETHFAAPGMAQVLVINPEPSGASIPHGFIVRSRATESRVSWRWTFRAVAVLPARDASKFIRWGVDGLAFRRADRIVPLRTPLVDR